MDSIEQYSAITRLLIDDGLYEISIENIEFIFRNETGLPNADDLKVKHYSTALKSDNTVLIDKIEHEFEHYLKSILLELETNNEEEISAITKALCHDEIEGEHLEAFIEKQSAILPSLEGVPTRFHESLFRLQKIEASWNNCLAFVTSESFDAATLANFLDQDHTQTALSSSILNDDEIALPLREFLFHNTDMQDDNYRFYVRALPKQFKQFPDEIDDEKMCILVEEQKVMFSQSIFSQLTDHLEYQVLFVANNIESYFEIKDQFALDDDFREKLLNSDISDDQKLKITEDMDLGSIVSLPSSASVIGNLFHRIDADINHLSQEVVQALITNTRPIEAQVSLFNKSQGIFSDDEVRQTLQLLPSPFPDMRPGWLRPTIPKTEVNFEFVKWLSKRRIISSWGDSFFGDDIQINNRRS